MRFSTNKKLIKRIATTAALSLTLVGAMAPSAFAVSSRLPDISLGYVLRSQSQLMLSEVIYARMTAAMRPEAAMPRVSPSRSKPDTSMKKPASSAVFASVTIPFGKLPVTANWQRVRAQLAMPEMSTCAGTGTSSNAPCTANQKRLAQVIAIAKQMPFQERLSYVSNAINSMITYTSDEKQYGKMDHWSAPAKTLAAGKGDCEDYAILKMAALKAMGIPDSSMSIVVLRVTDRNIYHAVLAVSTAQGHYILDNLRRNAGLDTSYRTYQPLYSMSGNRSWIHGFINEGEAIAAQTVDFNSVPG
ncbi:transglutaminase-like cysteine peptidase [Rhizobium sp. SL42]|uniref:transglutaminase-like cysteine peptidase n=1 Tax=Rhizobium sp. SL42 TaxID=2806346 RepID=UPI001F42C29C|nr:transglutaminase-like cysteine peptidase [Rhizobium sp. SL42]UJW77424.1 transglutaminase-like cysteine peptidase [Rhizobium sp. SL42]